MRHAAQCVGRALRGKTDYGIMVFADKVCQFHIYHNYTLLRTFVFYVVINTSCIERFLFFTMPLMLDKTTFKGISIVVLNFASYEISLKSLYNIIVKQIFLNGDRKDFISSS